MGVRGCQGQPGLQGDGCYPNVILGNRRACLSKLGRNTAINFRSGIVGRHHIHSLKKARDLLQVFVGTSRSKSSSVKFGQSRLGQIKFLKLGELWSQRTPVTKMADHNAGVQKDAVTKSRHRSDPIQPSRRARSLHPVLQTCTPPWPEGPLCGARGFLDSVHG